MPMYTQNTELLSTLSSHIIINGEAIPYPNPNRRYGHNITQVNGKLYCDGFEWKKRYWKRTLRAFWHLLF